jgi:hypothetical protein
MAKAATVAMAGDRLATTGLAGAVPASALSLSAAPATFQSAEVQQAYAEWLPKRWEEWKTNREEGDCKTTAAKLMTDFRAFYKESTGQTIADPFKGKAKWIVGTRERPNGMQAKIPTTGPLRPEYRNVKGQPAIDGPNHRIPGISADAVARTYTANVATRNGQALVSKSKGDGGFPKNDLRINQDLLQPGDVIFQQHRHPNDAKWDHAMTVLKVERDEQGRTKRLTMAIGSFDDLKDADSATPPTNLVNLYSYEQTIDFQDGNVSDSQITWQSDANLRPIGAGESQKERIHRAQIILGAEQRLTEVHNWK